MQKRIADGQTRGTLGLTPLVLGLPALTLLGALLQGGESLT